MKASDVMTAKVFTVSPQTPVEDIARLLLDQQRRRELIEPIRTSIDAGKPFLGICLGLQLLFDVSYEDGEHEGLGIVPGEVVRFEVPPEYKVPHMGWNRVQWGPQKTYFYFAHSYFCVPAQAEQIMGECHYGSTFAVALARPGLFACQFHPEKSSDTGLQLLRNFVSKRRAAYLDRPEPAFRTYGPRTRREFLNLLALTGGRRA